jgi:methylaspartate mutase epsilon subunit
MAIYLARNIRLDDLPEFRREVDMIGKEVRPVMDKVLEMGDGDVAIGAVRACEAGVVDIPWSPSRYIKSGIMPARDADGYIRILRAGDMPFGPEVLDYHEERLRRRAEKEGKPYGLDLAVSSVYEMSEDLGTLIPYPWAAE